MKLFTALFVLLATPALATQFNPGALDFEQFGGENLVVGAGTYRYYAAQRITSNDKEYSIDIQRRTFPSLVADGLASATYHCFPNNRFTSITFEHVTFCPYSRPEIVHTLGNCKSISTGVYKAEAWTKSMIKDDPLLLQLLRILKPNGSLLFKTPALKDRDDFTTMCLDQNETGLLEGFRCWKDALESAGFHEIGFEICYHENLGGYYAQMTAFKPTEPKRSKIELQRNDTPTLNIDELTE